MDLGLTGRVALITGGSSGIGAELATAYGREGARVAITYRSDHTGAERTAETVERAGGQAIAVPFDLADPDSARTAVATIIDRWNRVDVLVANAIAWPSRAPAGGFEALPPSAWKAGLRSNVEGNLALVQAVLPHMRATRWGRLLLVSTGLADEGMAGSETYTAAKAALHGLARSLAWGLGPDGILVNVLAAGLTMTHRNRATLPSHVREAISARVPLERLSTPEDLTGPVLFLTSAANTSITGEILREGSSTGRSSHTN